MWSREGNRYVHYAIPEPAWIPPGAVCQAGHSEQIFSGVDEASVFVQSTGLAAMNGGSVTTFNHNLDASFAYPQLELADAGGSACGISNTDRGLIHSGFAMVWVVKPTTIKLPLSGTYVHTINGVTQEPIVVIVDGNSFVLLRKTADAVLQLTRRLDALCL